MNQEWIFENISFIVTEYNEHAVEFFEDGSLGIGESLDIMSTVPKDVAIYCESCEDTVAHCKEDDSLAEIVEKHCKEKHC